ncbi:MULTISPECIES: hypothetical protein [Pandoraea]|uniref:hypothetical protein n=1 Tax=Pandoraea TaxID=93217 RepID=UPI001F5D56EF|nr:MULTISPECIES: hypothetical protein [Pandoraea]MCI3203793.1 hypothetical protein [Pandoraea sp. LA3]MDN4581819.1 hypothetical protein [Pandoraea capi]
MRLPFALAALDWIAPCDVQGARTLLDLDGSPGWTCPAAGGYCVATAVSLSSRYSSSSQPLLAATATDAPQEASRLRWLTRISLVIAGQAELRDDSLCIANETVWWIHRFDTDIPAAQVEAQLRRQLLACEMLSSQDVQARGRSSDAPAAPSSNGIGIASGAAGSARRLHALRRG